ncbi:MAG: VWA domain-containing protein [Rhizobiales bacterium]|nr:VWA domain-containing protein [Hyphomicrobiales bacterium]
MAFAVALYPVMVMISSAVDLSRISQQQVRLQAALDVAALRVARQISDGTLTGDMSTVARAIVLANINPSELRNVAVSAALDGSSVRVNGSGQISPMAISLVSTGSLTISGTASAIWQTKKIDLVLVLDNTGSMASSNKMTALKTAAKNLISTLSAAATRADSVRIGIVPFDTQVNIGTTYRDETWLSYAGVSGLSASNWTGCVTDRNQSYDVDDTAPTSSTTAFPARNCTTGKLATILPLTTDWTALTNKVDAMNPSGNTNITIGLAWGLHMLTPSLPLTNARTLAQEPYLERIIILLTDGDNTQNRWSSTGSAIDARTDLACANVKSNGIRLYTIRVIDGDAALLRRCASQSTMYYEASTADQLGPVFQRIAAEISQLRLSQ